MKINNLKRDLEWRGLLKDISNEDSLVEIVENGDKFYIGIDPTSDSIHIGHFLSLTLARVLNEHGLKPVLVMGGFTGMIGDPSGRNSEREVVSKEVIDGNVKKISKQIQDLSKKLGIDEIEIFNNSKVYEELTIIELFQKYGKLFNINTMLSKESVKNRIDNGISYTEFSYQLFQAIDFLYLYENKGVKLQLGGSDQWGNITAGTELIRKIHGSDVKVCGITINLLTDENGNKVGKTQGVPIWLDKEKTSPYIMFQYFINQSDETASKLLSQATDINEEEFNGVKDEHTNNPSQKILQNELAKRFISTVHSIEDYNKSFELSKILFEERYNDINEEQINDLKSLPSIQNKEITLMDLLIETEKVSSRRAYREFLESGSIKINGVKIEDENLILSDEFLMNKVAFINVGKKNKYLVWK